MSKEFYRVFNLELGGETFIASYGLFLNKVLHLELKSESGKAFFSETGYRSEFFGLVPEKELEEMKINIFTMREDELLEIIKRLHPNYPKTKNKRVVQLSLF